MGSKWKTYAFLAVVLFFIAYNPDGAAVVAGKLWGFFVDLMDGVGTVATSSAGE